ncbi:DUF1793-domain-containing protein [Xylariaceae sp. FL0016]|nr:DUF1793-domain-containing protein [Xylariaceae sp. FL0016]
MCIFKLTSVRSAFDIILGLLPAVVQGLTYSPLRPPAVPLAVRNPYNSVWSTTASGSTLNSRSPIFWTGKPLGWEGIVVVDGTPYEYMGSASLDLSAVSSSVPQDVSFDSQYSNFTFLAGPVTIKASFFSPITPKDTCRSSIPLSYLTTSIQSNDGQPHRIHFYSDVNAAWLALTNENDILWDLKLGGVSVNGTGNATNSPENVYTWQLSRKNNFHFGESANFPLWGNFTYNTSPSGAANFSFQSGYANTVRGDFAKNLVLSDDVKAPFYGFGNREPIFAFAHDLGVVNQASVRYTIGSIQDPIIRYLYHDGLIDLQPWWLKCYGEMYAMIHSHWDDFAEVQALANEFETGLQADIDAFYERNQTAVYSNNSASSGVFPANGTDQYGQPFIFDPASGYGFVNPVNGTGIAVPYVSEAESYYAILALSARQVMGAYVFATPPTDSDGPRNRTSDAIDPAIFQKEISSNGNVNTVDVLYPASPFFLYANPELLKFALGPVYEFQEDNFYPNNYCIHDIGSHFPNATGHVEGDDEYMPVEESANFILMSYAYYKFSGDKDWLTSHYPLLKRFTQYLITFSLVPESQFSTDDFAGTLQNQTNLAIKGIVGLQAMSSIATLAGNTYDALNFSVTAKSFYESWEQYGIDPVHKHTTLAYQWRSSWSLLYNIFFDKLLNMGLVNESVYSMQSDWYASVSQAYGVPLDNRHALTKSDWEIWAAATSSQSTRRLIVNSIAYWLNNTSTDQPFTDLFELTGTGGYVAGAHFAARPVVGGHFALLALGKSGQTVSDDAGNTNGSLFPKNSTDPLRTADTPIPPQNPRKTHGGNMRKSKRIMTTVSTNRPKTPRMRIHHYYGQY